QVEETSLGTEETRAAREVGVPDEYVGRHTLGRRTAFMGDDRAERGINRRAADIAPRVHAVRGGGMLVDDVVVHRAQGGDVLHQLGAARQVFAHLHAGDAGVDARVVAARLFRLGIAKRLRIP